ncbi:hypothetical protein EVAR_61757_1 [Eumeta japonica]|uniref:Uncharacterized protein n=1 Tax=Eumeta variegata TaxID=151549 RepID=A0A4C1ZCN6_EUMVA|nr:hypothetical protein EVAR_61757_1 [Eumeta japonica]
MTKIIELRRHLYLCGDSLIDGREPRVKFYKRVTFRQGWIYHMAFWTSAQGTVDSRGPRLSQVHPSLFPSRCKRHTLLDIFQRRRKKKRRTTLGKVEEVIYQARAKNSPQGRSSDTGNATRPRDINIEGARPPRYKLLACFIL